MRAQLLEMSDAFQGGFVVDICREKKSRNFIFIPFNEQEKTSHLIRSPILSIKKTKVKKVQYINTVIEIKLILVHLTKSLNYKGKAL